jgi:hypothetical protein
VPAHLIDFRPFGTWQDQNMRIALNALSIIAILVATAIAEETSTSDQQTPTSEGIMDLDGCRMARIFARFGYPSNVFAATDSKKNPTVCLDYDGYMFEIRQKNVIACYFFSPWDSEVLGCKLGDSPDEVLKKLGKPRVRITNKDGSEAMLWNCKDHDQELQVGFKENKCVRFVLSIK